MGGALSDPQTDQRQLNSLQSDYILDCVDNVRSLLGKVSPRLRAFRALSG
jgi:hypothetical protein